MIEDSLQLVAGSFNVATKDERRLTKNNNDEKRRATRFGPKDVTRLSSFSGGTMPLYRRMGLEGTEMNGEGKMVAVQGLEPRTQGL
jgi:hypothetical protein